MMRVGNTVVQTCPGCGNEFERPVGRDRDRKWCSENCRKRQYLTDATCKTCGAPTNYSGGDYRVASEECRPCALERLAKEKHAAAYERTKRMLAMRRAGTSNIAIGAAEGVSRHAVAMLLQRSRVARFPDLQWLPAPYAAKRGIAA